MPSNKKYKVPDRWMDYRDVGDCIPGTRFLPFKVPLKEDVCRLRMAEERWFTPAVLLERQPNLRLIIDLTNTDTDRYYFSKDFRRNGVDVMSVRCKGGGNQVPDYNLVRKFYNIVDDFLNWTGAPADDNDFLIGVHCTHGLNRTGYFICKYMVERMNISPYEAIRDFEMARGHKIEREVYKADIYRRPFGPSKRSRRNGFGHYQSSSQWCYTEADSTTRRRRNRRKQKNADRGWY